MLRQPLFTVRGAPTALCYSQQNAAPMDNFSLTTRVRLQTSRWFGVLNTWTFRNSWNSRAGAHIMHLPQHAFRVTHQPSPTMALLIILQPNPLHGRISRKAGQAAHGTPRKSKHSTG